MSDALSKARAALANVTPGPWGAADGGSFGGWWISLNGDPSNVTIAAVPIKLADADHIARYDPPTVAAMLDVIEAAEAALDRKSLHTEPCECANCLLSAALDRVRTLIGDDE